MNSQTTKLALICFILLSGVADIATFFAYRLYQFEINPIFMMTKSVAVLLLVKIILVAFLCWLVYVQKPRKSYIWVYMIIFAAVMAVILQGFGAYSNYSVGEAYKADPVNTIPLEPEQAAQAFTLINVLVIYFPMMISMIAFWFFERIYLEKEREKLKKEYKYPVLVGLIKGKNRKKKN